jgi:hypothetical protein
VTRKPSGSQGWVGRAASFAVAMLAVLTLVFSGAFHELTHADDDAASAAHVVAHIEHGAKADASGKSGAHSPVPAHSCSGHCGAHAATQAPLMALIPAPYEAHSGWLIEAGLTLSQQTPAGLERPPRA